MPSKSQFIEAMAKHLAPSASDLRLLDIGGNAAELWQLRRDLSIETASLRLEDWDYPRNSFDSVVAYDVLLNAKFVERVLDLMREGGRLIIVNPLASVDEKYLRILESTGYIRILLEAAVDGQGLLLRGEKAHQTADTRVRVQNVAKGDADALALSSYRGRFLYLLVQQSPNKPVWALKPDELIKWNAIGAEGHLLAFSSLPKAVAFMQSAVLQDFVRDVNKMPKFSKEKASNWSMPILLNPSYEALKDAAIFLHELDPKSAESPDE